MEANAASSEKDFKNKIHICKKESQETTHWLRMLRSCQLDEQCIHETERLNKEATEIILIFGKVLSTIKHKITTPA